jgi:hypothetical protein
LASAIKPGDAPSAQFAQKLTKVVEGGGAGAIVDDLEHRAVPIAEPIADSIRAAKSRRTVVQINDLHINQHYSM